MKCMLENIKFLGVELWDGYFLFYKFNVVVWKQNKPSEKPQFK